MRSTEFRRIYDQGARYTCPFFAAFYVCEQNAPGPRVGFTTPRALGGAVVRNRIKRRVREAVRLRLDQLNPQCSIVFNPRRQALDAAFPELGREVERFFRRLRQL